MLFSSEAGPKLSYRMFLSTFIEQENLMKAIQVKHIMQSESAHKRHSHNIAYENGAAFTLGEYRPIEQAMVPLGDPGFMQADATYEVVSVTQGYIFRLQDHLERFERSCEKFKLKNPYSTKQTAEILINLVKLTGLKDASIFWCVTRGFYNGEGFPDRVDYRPYDNQFYAFMSHYGFIFSSDAKRSSGADIVVSKDYVRIPSNSVDPTAKNFHWMDMKLSLFEALKDGYDWSVLLDSEGNLTESPGANIFVMRDGIVYTPDSGCLEGITRKTAIELCDELGISVKLAKVPVELLLTADEAFMTSTAGGIMPINSVDGRLLGGVNGPGKLSIELSNMYWEKRWAGWLGTPVEYDDPVPVKSES